MRGYCRRYSGRVMWEGDVIHDMFCTVYIGWVAIMTFESPLPLVCCSSYPLPW